MKKVVLIFLSMFLVYGANAQSLLVENFNYGGVNDTITNPAVGGSLWKRHSGTAGPIIYSNASLTYSGYSSSGVGGAVQLWNASTSREDANAIVNTTTSGNVYTSFLLNVSASGGATGDYFFHLNDSQGNTIGTNFRAKLWIKDGSSAGTFKLGLTKGAAVASAVFSQDYSLNTTYLVVLKYAFSSTTTSDDNVYAWVFASGIPTTEPAPQLTATDVSQSDLTKVRSVCLRQGTVGTDTCRIDGLRVSSSWNDAPLPVQFKSFTASKANEGASLRWSTASELNNKGFEIQRSVNGGKYQILGFVKGAGSSNTIQHYTFNDVSTVAGTVCYRLKQVDFNGNFEFSKSACLTLEMTKAAAQVITTPNPFNGELRVAYSSAEDATAQVEIIDMLGKSHYNAIQHVTKGANDFSINTESLPNGIYFIRVTSRNEITTQRIIKK